MKLSGLADTKLRYIRTTAVLPKLAKICIQAQRGIKVAWMM